MTCTRAALTVAALAVSLALPAQAGAAPVAAPTSAPALASAGSAEAAPAGRTEARGAIRTFGAFNVNGRLANHGRVDPVARHLVSRIRKREPYAMALQEVCGSQVYAAGRRLRKYRVAFFPTRVNCPGGSGFGNAVIIRNGPLGTFQRALPTQDGTRNVGCVRRARPKIAVCSTHLTAKRERGGERSRQAGVVSQVGQRFVRRGYATYVGGDFNDTPTAAPMDRMYRPAYGGGARGIWTESDGCCGRDGDPTLGTVKFDYGFLSWKWRPRNSFTADAPYSDHHILWTVARHK